MTPEPYPSEQHKHTVANTEILPAIDGNTKTLIPNLVVGTSPIQSKPISPYRSEQSTRLPNKQSSSKMGKGSNVQKAQQARERNQKKMGKSDEGM